MVRNKMQLEMRELAKLAKPQAEFQSQVRGPNDRACRWMPTVRCCGFRSLDLEPIGAIGSGMGFDARLPMDSGR